MNKERIKGVITQLSKIPDRKFNMGDWIKGTIPKVMGTPQQIANEKHACGTSACIAGWTTLLYADEPVKGQLTSDKARDLLDLTNLQAEQLFFAQDTNRKRVVPLATITRKQAINVLNRLLLTGKVDWSKRDEPVS